LEMESTPSNLGIKPDGGCWDTVRTSFMFALALLSFCLWLSSNMVPWLSYGNCITVSLSGTCCTCGSCGCYLPPNSTTYFPLTPSECVNFGTYGHSTYNGFCANGIIGYAAAGASNGLYYPDDLSGDLFAFTLTAGAINFIGLLFEMLLLWWQTIITCGEKCCACRHCCRYDRDCCGNPRHTMIRGGLCCGKRCCAGCCYGCLKGWTFSFYLMSFGVGVGCLEFITNLTEYQFFLSYGWKADQALGMIKGAVVVDAIIMVLLLCGCRCGCRCDKEQEKFPEDARYALQ